MQIAENNAIAAKIRHPMAEKKVPPNALYLTEQKTADTLSPSFLQKAGKRLKELLRGSAASRFEATLTPPSQGLSSVEINSGHLRPRRPPLRPQKRRQLNEKIINALKIIWEIIKYLAEWLIWLFLFLWGIVNVAARAVILLIFVLTNYQNRRSNILNNWAAEWRNYKEYFRHLPVATKILGLASIIIMLLLAFSAIFVYSRQKETARNRAYAETMESIKTKKDSAESALLYNNEEAEKNELEIARQLLSTLPCKSEAEKINCDKINNQLEGLFTKMRRAITVKPLLLSDWSGGGPKENAVKIFKINKKIVGYGPESSTIFIYDLLSKESRILQNQYSAPGFKAAAVPKEDDYAALLYGKNELARFNPVDGSMQKITVSYSADNAEISAIAIYSRRLYCLDAANNQIYRHESTRGGFDVGKDWLKEKTNLSGGMDMMVEGDVFALKSDGRILRFTSGRAQDFATSGIDPPLTNGNQIWSYTDLKYVYLLDSVGKRLLILEKTGRLKAQLVSPTLKNPTGMAIDEENKTAYVVDGNKLYTVALP